MLVSSGTIGESDDFVVVAARGGETAESLARTHLGDAGKSWMIEDFMGARTFARGQQITGAAMLVGTIGGGLLGQINLSLPYIVRTVLLLAVFVVAYVVMHDLGFEPRRVTAGEL